MCFVYAFPMELEYVYYTVAIYHLSPDPFNYVVSTHFLHSQDENYILVILGYVVYGCKHVFRKLGEDSTYCDKNRKIVKIIETFKQK